MAKAVPLKENIVPEHYTDAAPKLAPEMTAEPPKKPELTKFTGEDGKTITAEILSYKSYEDNKGKVIRKTVLLNTNINQETGKRQGKPSEVEAQLEQVK